MPYRNEIYFDAVPDREPAFPKEEFDERLSRIRAVMAREEMDCLFLTSPESMYYLSGYQCMWYQTESPVEWPPSNGFAVHVDHDGFIHFESEREAFLTRMFSVDGDVRYFPPESYRDGTRFIVDELKAQGWLNGTVGLEHRAMRPNPAVSGLLQSRMERGGRKWWMAAMFYGKCAGKNLRRKWPALKRRHALPPSVRWRQAWQSARM